MDNVKTIPIKEYLTRKDIPFREEGEELVVSCLFNSCDDDSTGNEAHLYFSSETGQYQCKKCGESGNTITLAKHLGDDPKDVLINPEEPKSHKSSKKFNDKLVESCHEALPERIKEYLIRRGISEELIDKYKIGYGRFYGRTWITTPVKDKDGKYIFFKLRRDPEQGDKKGTYPKGVEAQIYDWDMLKSDQKRLVLCEGEMDRFHLLSKGISAVCSSHGVQTFKKKWVSQFDKDVELYICFDNDDPAKAGVEKVSEMLDDAGYKNVYRIDLPAELGEKGDVTDYFTKLGASVEDFFGLARRYPEDIDVKQFQPVSIDTLSEVLGLTIKKDEVNKVVAFLCQLSAFTKDSQLNTAFISPSSTGKSYIPLEIATLFPIGNVTMISHCSPTSFFHDHDTYDQDENCHLVDFTGKIIIFVDQPKTAVLERLRPILSHDAPEILSKVTDKSQRLGFRTKNIKMKGFPAVIFCSAGLKVDEQESTRFMLLSPEISQEKIREAILAAIDKETDIIKYYKWLEGHPERKLLKDRIRAIKREKIQEIRIDMPEKVKEMFFDRYKKVKHRHMRDIKRVMSLTKLFALLNLWWRKRDGDVLIADETDIQQAFKIWDTIAEAQDLNLPPYIYKLYQSIFLPLWEEKNPSNNISKEDIKTEEDAVGLTRQELADEHFDLYGTSLRSDKLRFEILPMLERAGLIYQEKDPDDKRTKLIYITLQGQGIDQAKQ